MIAPFSRHGLLLLGLLASTAQAQSDPSLPPQTEEAITEKVQADQKTMGIPGLSVAIGWEGKIRYSKAFGQADVEQSVPVTTKTRFRTASIAKPVTAVAIMQLVSQGKLALEDDILKHVPKYRLKEWSVTVKDLLCHQGGVRHYIEAGESHWTEVHHTVHESMRIFDRHKLLHEPGTKFSYSTYGYTLLGAAIISSSKTPYDEFMREHVWEAAGMASTVIDQHFEVIPHRARGYMFPTKGNRKDLTVSLNKRVKKDTLLRAPLHDTSMKVPGGGMLSTSEDLVRFGMAMMQDGRLVSADARKQMWTPVSTKSGKETRAGLGWFVFRTSTGTFVGHTGGQAGVTCALMIHPETGVVAAVMCNLQEQAG